jgi:ATP-binding cassette subfamily B protein
MKRINNIFKIKQEIVATEEDAYSEDVQGGISFKNVSFKYEMGQTAKDLVKQNFLDFVDNPESANGGWVLENLNFDIKPGMQVGIVGFTGSGKSTLVNLIPRLDDPQRGSISIDGVDIKDYSLNHLRRSVGYVTQMPFLFSKTIKENILFGSEETLVGLDPEEIDKRVLDAARVSHLKEDISEFPKKYETLIGERGVTLSGGQKQRLAIARAILARPRILVLDDSFSNVDTNTEEMILSDLKAKTENITTIIISHRISTIKDSDLIIVLDEGRVDSMGKHGELMKKCEIYQNLYQRQQLSEELDEEL